jgi:exodeoxyribonuclease V gamma subunit
VRQLDAFDDAQQARQRFALPRLDLFDEEGPTTARSGCRCCARCRPTSAT